jgi:hypothetical protein
MKGLLVVLVALVVVPVALALPGKGVYKGRETPSTITVAADGRTLTAVKLAPKAQPAACKLKTPVLTKLKLSAAGLLLYKATVPNTAGKPLKLTVRIEFYTPYLGNLSTTYSGSGCSFAFSDTLAK